MEGWCSTGSSPRTCCDGRVERASRLSFQEQVTWPVSLCSGPVEGRRPGLVERVLKEVGTNFNNMGVVAKREASQRSELSGRPSVSRQRPELEEDVHDLAGVLELGRHIWSWGGLMPALVWADSGRR